MKWTRLHILLAGLGLIAATNAVALLGVAYNRSGEPDSRLLLSERELNIPYRWELNQDNNGLALHLQWRIPGARTGTSIFQNEYGHFGEVQWLNRDKLIELGFNLEQAPDTVAGRRHYAKVLPKDVWLVMEHDGPMHQAALTYVRERLQREEMLLAQNLDDKEFTQRALVARKALQEEEQTASRLFVIDAGLDAGTLRAKYPGRTHYAIVRGRVKPWLDRKADKEVVVAGHVQNLSVTNLHVPRDLRDGFAPLADAKLKNRSVDKKKFTATVAIGHRYEPWIVDIAAQ